MAKPTYKELERRIQELEKAESALYLAEDRLRKIFNNSQDAIFIHDLEGKILDVNDKMCRMYGLTKEEALEVTFEDLSSPEMSMRILLEKWQKVLNGEKLLFEWEARRPKDKGIFNVEVSIQKISFHDKDIVLASIRDITERKRAEASLRKREEKYRLLFNMGVNAMFLVDNNTTQILECNNKASELFGYSPQELLSMKMTDLSTTPEATRRTCQEKVFKKERVYRKKDGGFISVDISTEHFYLGSRLLHLSAIRDITYRKHAEKALMEKTSFLQNIIDTISDLVSVTDMKGNFKFLAPSYIILGYDLDSLVGRNVMEYVHPDDYQKIEMAFAEFLANREDGRKVEYRYRQADGNYLWFETVGRFLFDETGSPKELLFISRDFTERKQVEAEIEKTRDQFQSLVNNIPGAVYRCRLDKDWTMLFMSDAIHTLSGYPASDFIGNAVRTYESVIHPDDTDYVAQCVNSAVDEFRHWNIEYRICHKDGDIRWVQEKGKKITTEDDGVASLDGLILDITDRRKAEEERENLQEQLRQAQKMESVGRLAGGVAHDFNNMLGVILGHTELALLKADEDNDLISDLKEIQTAAARSADITKQLLAFARKQAISPRKLNLNDTVESMLKMLRRLIGEDIDLVWEPAAQIWPVKMDPSQIHQILANLCINAKDAISGVGKITIESGINTFDDKHCSDHPGLIPGDFVLLAVSDNGCGMDQEILENLFEPFFTTKEVGKGTGLGLATVYGIVSQNSGFINVYSETGQGTTFKIYLPRLIAHEDNDNKTMPEKNEAAGGTETILLVEDEPTVLRMTRIMLERKGYTVLSAASPTEAMEKARHHSGFIDLLMTDVVMPGMNGRDLAEKILDFQPDIKLLFMSGYTEDIIAHQGVLDDGVTFIQKPFSMGDMAETLRGILDKEAD